MSQEPIPYKAVQTGSPALAPEGAIPIALYAPGGSGGGAVDSVNGKTGDVVLSASDVGAATTAQGTKADTAVQPAALAGKMGTETPTTFWGVFAVGSEPTPPADGKVHWGFRV